VKDALRRIGLGIVLLVAFMFTFTKAGDLMSAASNFKLLLGIVLAVLAAVEIGLALFLIGREVLDLMRRFGLIAMVAFVLIALTGCTKVEPGWSGIRVKLYGKQRGVQDFPIVTGRVWYNPWTEEIYQFPTFMQNVVWTRSEHEGSSYDESFTANSQEGVPFNFDVGLSYQIESAKVPELFLKFREDYQTLTNVYIRNQVRDFFSIEASKMQIMQIVGPGKQLILANVQGDLERKLGPDGIHIDNVSFIGRMRLPEQVEASINAVIEATQRAQEAQNKVAQSKAEAEQRVAEANGIAQATLIKAKAQADANQILAASLTPVFIQYEALTRWNGILPSVTGGAIPFIQLPQSK